ncbi:hypothetical protein [Pleionea mediterranea]|uniref:Uncharacterized protein n=1 Tax=Pleionea mediterranea TaxID=523701 RepID=A0A316FAR1_9GAMM|nr:hypothetical protein [Pleionea mediterranea]PWK45412.1 hypothetical protein C8D97_11485 [Pleionea mediterranea]
MDFIDGAIVLSELLDFINRASIDEPQNMIGEENKIELNKE